VNFALILVNSRPIPQLIWTAVYISKKNLARLEQLAKSEEPQLARLAAIVLEVARVTPYKRRRLKILARNHRDLLRKLGETGLVFADNVPDSVFDETHLEEAEFFEDSKTTDLPDGETGRYRFEQH